MQVTVEDVSSVKKILHIEVPEEVVVRELDAAYKELKKTSKIKGFRPGKAPRSVLERMFAKDVNADVSQKLVQESLMDALREKELPVIGEPQIDPSELDPKSAFKYDVTIELKPEIADIEYKGIDVKKTMYAASEDEVDAQIQMLRKNLAKKEPIAEERAVVDGDFVLVTYEGMQNNQPFPGLPLTENSTLKIGTASVAKELDDAIIGMTAGEEKIFDMSFAADNMNPLLAGQTVTCKVNLESIMEEILPEIDDEFAKQFGQFDSLAALKAEINKNLEQGYTKRIDQELNEQIFEDLITKTEFEIPESMVEYELDGIVAEAEKAFAANNVTMEDVGQSVDKIRVEYRETAEKQVRRHLILGKMIEQESLAVTEEELDKGFEDLAANFNQPVEMIKSFYKENADKVEFFKHTLLEKKAIALIIENSNITEVDPEEESAQVSGDETGEKE